MAKRKIRLTESQLISLIKKTIKEHKSILNEGAGTFDNPYTDEDLQKTVNYIVNEIDGWVDVDNIKNLYNELLPYRKKVALDDSDPDEVKKVSAIYRISQLYQIEEGESLIEDLNDITTATVDEEGTKLLPKLKLIVSRGMGEDPNPQQTPAPAQTSGQNTPTPSTPDALSKCASKEVGYETKGDYFIITTKNGYYTGYNDGKKLKNNPNYNFVFIPNKEGAKREYGNARCEDPGPGVKEGLNVDWATQ